MWHKYSKWVWIVRYSKNWWNKECQSSLVNYRSSKQLENWKTFKNIVNKTKRTFFNNKIQEMTSRNHKFWDLISWVWKQKLPAMEAIQFNSRPCIKLDNLWQALHLSFNSAHNCQININILNEISLKPVSDWKPFLKEEFNNAIRKCNDSSAPRPDKILWKILKWIINDNDCLISIINITNVCINLGHCPLYFKSLTSIIISKPNKSLYDSPKFFYSIMLLNTLGKLIEKVIGERIQFYTISNNFVHPHQFGRLKKYSTFNVSMFLTYIIRSRWVKNIQTSTLAFYIIQFFPLLNHWLLSLILDKAGFHSKVSTFFSDYLIGRKTQYMWNNLFSPFFEVKIGVGQGSALSLILSALYLSLLFYIFEKWVKNLKILVFFLSFVDNRLLISQEKCLEKTDLFLFIVIILFLPFCINLVWLLNMKRLKSFTLLDLITFSIPLY